MGSEYAKFIQQQQQQQAGNPCKQRARQIGMKKE